MSNQNASFQSRETSASSPVDRRPTSSTFSAGRNRLSIDSNDTGESSTAGSQRSSLMSGGLGDATVNDGVEQFDQDNHKVMKDGRESHRTRKSRNAGGFLLGNAVIETPLPPAKKPTVESVQQRQTTHNPKGKTSLRSPEKRHVKRRSGVHSAIGGSPLATNVINAGTGNGAADSTRDGVEAKDHASRRTASAGLDVDSAQIVNLALNLSESRRNASRRIISTPLPPQTGFGDSFVGGSLRQHLEQQRRVSRNVSPKPDRAQRAVTASPRVPQGVESPLQAGFDASPEASYQYHFSASTLARAEKAKKAIELMAQYRRLLHYVPPLKPSSSTSRGATPDSPGTSTHGSYLRPTSSNTPTRIQYGRQYNPLQYIRNRKVRARNSRAIDGDAQGFGDLEKVSDWVDGVAQQASHEDLVSSGLPPFSKAAGEAASPHASPQNSAGKGHNTLAKIKRPRIDWLLNPEDLIADVFWLEQDSNKSMIEDRHGRRVFPHYNSQQRPVTRQIDTVEPPKLPPATKANDLGIDIRLDTKLPEFRSVKHDRDRSRSRSRTRRKLRNAREATRLYHGHNGSTREAKLRLQSYSKSDSDSSDSDMGHPSRRRRSGTAETFDRGHDILEKQMREMVAREQQASPHRESVGISRSSPAETQKPARKDEQLSNGKAKHGRSDSLATDKRSSLHAGSSGRASLEVPGGRPRSSTEELNLTAPSSPVSKTTKIKNAFISSNDSDHHVPKSRQTSPTRNPLSKVKSKIKPLYSKSTEHEHTDEDQTLSPPMSPLRDHTPEYYDAQDPRRRSMSPIKRASSKTHRDGLEKAGSIRKSKPEDSGIRGLFKARNPVSRVSDLLFKKEPVAVGTSSGFSTDDSDSEDTRLKPEPKCSRESSAGLDNIDDASPTKERSSYLSRVPALPVFTSPFERRGRPTHKAEDIRPDPDSSTNEKRFRAGQKQDNPRFDIQNASPSSSPDVRPNRYDRDSSVSDIESRRNSISMGGVKRADSRLNSILGLPGKRRNALPVTGLSSLETSHDTRPSLDGKRQWSISDRGISTHGGPMTKREIARVKALLLSSGIKAKELARRAAECKDLKNPDESSYHDLASIARHPPPPVPKSQEHRLAARIISDDVQLSSQLWRSTADDFVNNKVAVLIENIASLQHRLLDNLTPMTRTAADEADEVSKDLVTSQTLKVKRISDTIDKMTRRRRRRFRWLRRGGWVLVEWALVGIMWYVWFMVVIARVFMGVGRGVVGGVRWLFWLD